MLVAAGAGAGIATTFNAPIGGLMFAQEIVLLGHTEIANLTLLIIATFTAVITSRAIIGNAVVFRRAEFVLRSYWEMATYALMGAALGVLAAGYIRFFNATEAWFRRLESPGLGRSCEAGLAVVGVIAIWLPQNLSDGYPVINRAMAGEFGIGMLAALTCAKIFASSVSLGCGAPGGSFGPTFFIGTMAGGLVPARVGDADSAPDGAARIVRAGRARRVSGRDHACAADGAVPALGDDAKRHHRAAFDDRDDHGAGGGARDRNRIDRRVPPRARGQDAANRAANGWRSR